MKPFTPHHIGCAVPDLAAACRVYGDSLGLARRSRTFDVRSQQVAVQFIELRDGFFLELVAPSGEQGPLAPFLKLGFYHLCFLVPDLASARVALRKQRHLPLAAFESEAFGHRPCQFFMNPLGHLIELAEMAPDAFDRWIELGPGEGTG